MLKFLLRKLMSDKMINDIKRVLRKSRQINKKKISLKDFNEILSEEFGLSYGDTIIVHSSFGGLNVDASPMEVIDVLKCIVGDKGNIMMPYYPPGKSQDWLVNENVFDLYVTKSSMGIISNIFAKSENTIVSEHPIKAMAIWGKDKEQLAKDHSKSITPFDKLSPYFKGLLLGNYKTLGIGIEKNAFFHCCEDVIKELSNEILYGEQLYSGKVSYKGKLIKSINTYVHDTKKCMTLMDPTLFLKNTECPTYLKTKNKNTLMYIVDNKEVYDHLSKRFKEGTTRKK